MKLGSTMHATGQYHARNWAVPYMKLGSTMHETGQYHARHCAAPCLILGSTVPCHTIPDTGVLIIRAAPARLVCGTGDKRKVVGRGGERVGKEGGGDRSNGVNGLGGRRRRGGRRNIGRWVENLLKYRSSRLPIEKLCNMNNDRDSWEKVHQMYFNRRP
jgi:hypothetical protein